MMNEPALERLTQRLGRLEREVKCWRVGIVCSLAVLGIVALLPGTSFTASPRVVEASKFILRDDAGKVRATMHANPGGSFDFSIFDADEKHIALLSQWGLYFFWGSQRARASMFWKGEPLLYLTDKDGKV